MRFAARFHVTECATYGADCPTPQHHLQECDDPDCERVHIAIVPVATGRMPS